MYFVRNTSMCTRVWTYTHACIHTHISPCFCCVCVCACVCVCVCVCARVCVCGWVGGWVSGSWMCGCVCTGNNSCQRKQDAFVERCLLRHRLQSCTSCCSTKLISFLVIVVADVIRCIKLKQNMIIELHCVMHISNPTVTELSLQ
jgi:hypothetical protein